MSTTTQPRFERNRLRHAIQDAYREVAQQPSCTFHFNNGRPLTNLVGYTETMLQGIPESTVASFAGTGNPFSLGTLADGATVLDIGCGAGLDVLLASRMVGVHGKAIGVDMTREMLDKARQNARQMGASNVQFMRGYAEALPVDDASVDVIISNGVLNLCPNKEEAFAEMYRVLKPGGRFQIADVLVDTPVPTFARDLIHLWVDCVAGGTPNMEYVEMLRNTGFQEIEVVDAIDVFKDAQVELDAQRYGAMGFNIKGVKPHAS